eukprot:248164-Rhodomonas_salina.2
MHSSCGTHSAEIERHSLQGVQECAALQPIENTESVWVANAAASTHPSWPTSTDPPPRPQLT